MIPKGSQTVHRHALDVLAAGTGSLEIGWSDSESDEPDHIHLQV